MNTELKIFERFVEHVISELLIVEGLNFSLESLWGKVLFIVERSDGQITIPTQFNTYLDNMLGTENDHRIDGTWNLVWYQQDIIIKKIYLKLRKNNNEQHQA